MQNAITLTVDGLTLRGMEHLPDGLGDGKAPAVILYHGFTGTMLEPHRLFLKISRALTNLGFACFRFDFSGSGESDGDFEEMTVSREIREASAIMDFVKLHPSVDAHRVNILGLSLGGFIAGALSGDRKEEVSQLVLLAPAGNMRDLILGGAQAAGMRATDEFHDLGGNRIGKPFVMDLMGLDGFQRARPYQGPVLLIHGTDDPTVPVAVSHRYQAEVYAGRAKMHLLEGADHTFNSHLWESEVISTLCDFLSPHIHTNG
jgi:uncharacterized protein